MEIKGIIFDYGGTLDTNGDHWSHVIRDGWKKAGVEENDALFREAYVFAERELERTLHILPHHNFSDLLQIKMRLELGYLASQGHFPPAMVDEKADEIAAYCYGVAKETTSRSKEVLAKLAEKYPLVLVSNFYGNIRSVLKDFGLLDYFKALIESAEVGVRKPDAKIFELGIKALGLKPEEVLVVGDSIKNDIDPARSLGCQTLRISGKEWNSDVVSRDDVNTIDNLEDVLDFIDGVNEVD